MAQHAWPRKFRERDILVIAVSDPVWMQQLSLQKLAVLDALNRLLPPEGMIRDIRFEIGNIDQVRRSHIPSSLRNSSDRQALPQAASHEPACSKIPPAIKAQAEALTEPVKDQELKNLLQQAYLKSRQREKA